MTPQHVDALALKCTTMHGATLLEQKVMCLLTTLMCVGSLIKMNAQYKEYGPRNESRKPMAAIDDLVMGYKLANGSKRCMKSGESHALIAILT